MMTPDKVQQFIATAKKAGHKDDEIAQFIAQQSKVEAATPTPTPEEPKKGFLQSVGEIFNKGLTQTIGMVTGAPKLGAQAEATTGEVTKRSDQMRQLAMQARNEVDPIKKQALLAESRRLSGEVEKLGTGIESATSGFQKKFDITDKDVKEGTNLGFAAKRGAKTAIDTGIMLMPTTKLIKTVGGASKTARVVASTINSAITGATISALDEATSLEDITPEERFQRTVDAGLWGAGIGGAMGAGGETFKLIKEKLFADKKIAQQVAMMFTPKTSEKLRFENSFGTSFEDEFKQRDLVALSALAKKGQVTEKEIAQYMGEKAKDFMGTKKELLKSMTAKTGGAPKETVVEALRRVASEWAQSNELSPEDVKALNQKIKIIGNNKNATIPWEKIDDYRAQFGELGEAAYKVGGKESIFANAETAIRNMVEDAGKEIGNIKALNKGISYYKLAQQSIANKGANELKKVANDITQFTLQTLPIMAAGGTIGGLMGGDDNTGKGVVAGAAGTIGAVAIGKGLRLNMASPAGRLKMASWLEKNAAKLKDSPKLIKELINRIARSSVTKGSKDLMMGEPTSVPAPGLEPAPTTAPGKDGVTAQAQVPEQMFDVKDSKTGKVIQVPQSKLADYGINVPAEQAAPEMMTKEEATANIIAAAQAGDSKAVTRWTAALDAISKAEPAEAKKTEAQRSADAATSLAKTALADFQKGGIKTGPLALIEEGKSKVGTKGTGHEPTIKFDVKVNSLKAMIAKARAGTSFTANEEELLDSYTPKVGDTEQRLRIKLEQLANPEDPDLMSALTKVSQFNTQPVVQ